jgi:hypothetical protein
MDEVIQRIVRQFPEREILIRRLWSSDEDFRDLCQDYTLCLETLAHWSTEATSPTRIAEYLSLCRQLELEIEIKTQKAQPESWTLSGGDHTRHGAPP